MIFKDHETKWDPLESECTWRKKKKKNKLLKHAKFKFLRKVKTAKISGENLGECGPWEMGQRNDQVWNGQLYLLLLKHWVQLG